MKKTLQKIKWVDKSKFVRCDCFGHALEVRRDMEIVDGKITHKNFEICIWERYGESNRKMSWRERIRWCWQVLRTGRPWADQVTISDDKAKKLAEFILTEEKQTNKAAK